ncbi:MAG TPA: hypothetical protein VGJ20_21030, partial [Xanthobacteraceae bacterium]
GRDGRVGLCSLCIRDGFAGHLLVDMASGQQTKNRHGINCHKRGNQRHENSPQCDAAVSLPEDTNRSQFGRFQRAADGDGNAESARKQSG